jgi:hypothetical protein
MRVLPPQTGNGIGRYRSNKERCGDSAWPGVFFSGLTSVSTIPNPYEPDGNLRSELPGILDLLPRARFPDLQVRSPVENGGGAPLVIVPRRVQDSICFDVGMLINRARPRLGNGSLPGKKAAVRTETGQASRTEQIDQD